MYLERCNGISYIVVLFGISWYYLVFFAGTEIPFLFAAKWLMLRFRGFELQIYGIRI